MPSRHLSRMTADGRLAGFEGMWSFDPSKPAELHDELNDKIFEWNPEWKAHWEKYADHFGDGIIGWDGLLIDRWRELRPG
jgi:hypothetical protein